MAGASSPAGQAMAPREGPAWVEPLAEALAEALPRLAGTTADPLLGELIHLLTAALERGEIAIQLDGPAPPGVRADAWPAGHRRAVATSPLASDPEGPLVLHGERLAWRRWQERQESVIAGLLARVGAPGRTCQPPPAEDPHRSRRPGLDPQQRQAVAAVLSQRLVVLQGGPGTGKTSTVVRMLEAVLAQEPTCRIQLAAPTGKAATRLGQACGGAHPCGTLHRLLESRGARFQRNRLRPLAVDLLVVDEVSMVDLDLMAAVLDALPEPARLVLVGDPAQLPPIAPGSPLLELQAAPIQQALGPSLVTLRTTHRNDGAIAEVAAELRRVGGGGDPLASLGPRLRQLGADDNLLWREAPGPALPEPLLVRLRAHQRSMANLAAVCHPEAPDNAPSLLAERDRLLVLTPLRRGRWSVEAIHRALLGPAAEAGPAAWPLGTPVLCTRNREEWGLANGDLGVRVAGKTAEGRPQPLLLFGDGDGPLWLHPAQLAEAVEPALALTVHKAQGSEAAEVIVLMGAGAVDARLLYTALTRARRQALLITAAAES